MAEAKPKGAAGMIRAVVMLVVLAVVAFFIWRQATRVEGYTGGDVVTTGTVQAVHVDLGFKVPGRIADVPVAEGDDVLAGQIVGTLETQDLDVQVASARAARALARASVAQARAIHDKAVRDLARQRELIKGDATTQQQLERRSRRSARRRPRSPRRSSSARTPSSGRPSPGRCPRRCIARARWWPWARRS